jgi:fructokinase
MTDGPRGAYAWNDAGVARADTRAVAVVDTVGAGDSFMSALLAEIAARGLLDRARLAAAAPADLEPILAFANAAAGITCSRRGSNPPRRTEIAV